MRLIKLFLFGLIGLFVFSTLLSLLFPSTVKVSRTVFINNLDKNKIYTQIADLQNWKNWNPIFQQPAATIKFQSDNESKSCSIIQNNKSAALVIVKTDSSAINFNLTQNGELITNNDIIISSDAQMQQSKVDWIATTHLRWYPWEKFYSIFIDKLTGNTYDVALNGLKKYVESQ